MKPSPAGRASRVAARLDASVGQGGKPGKLCRIFELHGFGKSKRKRAYEHFRYALKGVSRNEDGQSTVEYAVIVGASLAVVVALGLLAEALNDGMFVQHAISAASHNLQVLFGGAADVFSY